MSASKPGYSSHTPTAETAIYPDHEKSPLDSRSLPDRKMAPHPPRLSPINVLPDWMTYNHFHLLPNFTTREVRNFVTANISPIQNASFPKMARFFTKQSKPPSPEPQPQPPTPTTPKPNGSTYFIPCYVSGSLERFTLAEDRKILSIIRPLYQPNDVPDASFTNSPFDSPLGSPTPSASDSDLNKTPCSLALQTAAVACRHTTESILAYWTQVLQYQKIDSLTSMSADEEREIERLKTEVPGITYEQIAYAMCPPRTAGAVQVRWEMYLEPAAVQRLAELVNGMGFGKEMGMEGTKGEEENEGVGVAVTTDEEWEQDGDNDEDEY